MAQAGGYSNRIDKPNLEVYKETIMLTDFLIGDSSNKRHKKGEHTAQRSTQIKNNIITAFNTFV